MSRLLSVSLPDELRESIDALAAALGRSRSEIVREALRSYLWRERWALATREARSMSERKGLGPEEAEDLVDETRNAG